MTALAIVLALVAVAALVAWRRDRVALLARLERLDQVVSRLGAGAPHTSTTDREASRLGASAPHTSTTDGEASRLGAGAPHTSTTATEREFVITHLGEVESEPERAPVKVSLTGPAFADAVVRETVVQTASLVHGVRRALAPETRNRIRFEMKREVKRSRKDRKTEMKQALREHRARQREDIPVVAEEEGVA